MSLPMTMVPEFVPGFIPSPSQGVWHLGPFPVRAYALAIITGVVVAVWVGEKRWIARGGASGQIGDVALWAVPFGLVGARLYHVITDHDLYFSHADKPDHNWNPLGALEIWHGGLGIWGAIAGGAFGAWFACRRSGLRMLPLMDALAPALLLAQAIGRWGNYFNQELFGKATTKPWGLKIDRDHIPQGYDLAKHFPKGPPYTFHPTFLYESLWDLSAAGVVLYADRKLRLGFGRCFALYVMAYCLGRGWIEYLRIDNVEYNNVLGLRLNVWTSIILGTGALIYFVVAGRRHPAPGTRETSVYRPGHEPGAGREDGGAGIADVSGDTPGDTPKVSTPLPDPPAEIQ